MRRRYVLLMLVVAVVVLPVALALNVLALYIGLVILRYIGAMP